MIQKIHSIEEAKEHLNTADQDTLVLFDVDQVLTQASEPAFQMSNMRKHHLSVKQVMADFNRQQRDLFECMLVSLHGVSLVEEQFIPVIRGLRDNNIKSIAITAAFSGSVSDIENMAHWRRESLHSLGIDFSYSFPLQEEIFFQEFPEYYGSVPKFYQGLLFSNGEALPPKKGAVLLRFFREVNWAPKKVVFVDDRLENLTSVEKVLTELDPTIQFFGFHYQGAFSFPSKSVLEEDFLAKWQKLAEQAKLSFDTFAPSP